MYPRRAAIPSTVTAQALATTGNPRGTKLWAEDEQGGSISPGVSEAGCGHPPVDDCGGFQQQRARHTGRYRCKHISRVQQRRVVGAEVQHVMYQISHNLGHFPKRTMRYVWEDTRGIRGALPPMDYLLTGEKAERCDILVESRDVALHTRPGSCC